ncbi:hypothetical protein SAMN02745866_00992 [Alteromonadaceae bacterium Bs31]|nr:hypothetical protein SAMN02745866_00992 [Alteromonadaceae bacterium Bs31]
MKSTASALYTDTYKEKLHQFECCLKNAENLISDVADIGEVEFSMSGFVRSLQAFRHSGEKDFNWELFGVDGFYAVFIFEKGQTFSVIRLKGKGARFDAARDILVKRFHEK